MNMDEAMAAGAALAENEEMTVIPTKGKPRKKATPSEPQPPTGSARDSLSPVRGGSGLSNSTSPAVVLRKTSTSTPEQDSLRGLNSVLEA
jgi:hypothetical protein